MNGDRCGSVLPTERQIRLIAAAVHEVLCAYDLGRDGHARHAWGQLSTEQHETVIAGVRLALHGTTAEALHEAWCLHKRPPSLHAVSKGEAYQQHAELVPFAELAGADQCRDQLFVETVATMLTVMCGDDKQH